jgi:hypothetical protein
MSDLIKTKIRKLLELAASDNANEAALAMSMAQELMDRHKLDMAELNQTEIIEPIIEDPQPFFEAGRMRQWKLMLANALARHNDCIILQFKSGGRENPKNVISIFGRQTDIDHTRFIFAYALDQLIKLSVLPCIGSGIAYKDSWYQGAVHTIMNKLNEMKTNLKKEYSQYAVIKYESLLEEVQRFVNDKYNVVKSKNSNHKSIDPQAYNDGRKAGNNVEFNRKKKSSIGMR